MSNSRWQVQSDDKHILPVRTTRTIDNCLRLDMRLQWNTCSVSHMLHRQFVLDYYRKWLVCLIWFCVYCIYSYNCFKELKYFLGPIGQQSTSILVVVQISNDIADSLKEFGPIAAKLRRVINLSSYFTNFKNWLCHQYKSTRPSITCEHFSQQNL